MLGRVRAESALLTRVVGPSRSSFLAKLFKGVQVRRDGFATNDECLYVHQGAVQSGQTTESISYCKVQVGELYINSSDGVQVGELHINSSRHCQNSGPLHKHLACSSVQKCHNAHTTLALALLHASLWCVSCVPLDSRVLNQH